MPKKKTKEQFIQEARKVHGNRYDYSKVIYAGSDSKICVICSQHGEFWPTPNNHLRGSGCPYCAGKRLTRELFIEKAKDIHGDKYDYSNVEYVNSSTLVKIICPEHGEFNQKPSLHLSGNGCSECAGQVRMTTERFIRKAKELYGDIYDYSKTEVIGDNKTKVCVICPEHGEFWVTPNNHLRGSRCPGCFGTPKKTTEQFIEEAKAVYGDAYDYSQVVYNGNKEDVTIVCKTHGPFKIKAASFLKGYGCQACRYDDQPNQKDRWTGGRVYKVTKELFLSRSKVIHDNRYDYSKIHYIDLQTKVQIVCPNHGEFWQKPSLHLRGYGCQYCGGGIRLTNEQFQEKARRVHKGFYDYSKAEYINTATKLCIICPEHGEFWQIPNNHLLGAGCPKCAGKYNDLEFFIERAQKVHGDKYNYGKAKYVATNEKVCIVCPEHGEFWQTPSAHMNGAGCPACNQKHLEREVMLFLKRHKIKFEVQKSFHWLRYIHPLHLDFFLPDYSIAIECQGGQHFSAIDFFGGERALSLTIERDALKKKQCEEHGIRMLYYSDLNIIYPYFVIEDLETLLLAIKNDGFENETWTWKEPELPLIFDDE